MATVTQVGQKRPGRAPDAVRGKVQGFTRASRLRMLQSVLQVDRSRVEEIFFATLTVPRDEADWEMIERHRLAWCKRLARKWGDRYFLIWKKEAHKSGTPHLHALIFWLENPPKVGEFRAWNDDAWAAVVKSDNPHHRDRACRVERMRSWQGVASYCAKYLAKDQEGFLGETGRIWGVERRDLRPVSLAEENLSAAVGKRYLRALRKLSERRRRRWYLRTKEGRTWLYPRKIFRDGRLVGRLTVEDQIAQAKAVGLRVGCTKPAGCVTLEVDVWAEVEETRMIGCDRRYLEKEPSELHSFASSLHFVLGSTAEKLLAWCLRHDEWESAVSAEIPV